jgi:hypothetical protein
MQRSRLLVTSPALAGLAPSNRLADRGRSAEIQHDARPSMKLISIILTLVFTLSALAEEKKPPSIEASAIYRTTVSAAKSLVVFEGLPHPMFEKKVFAAEIKRKDTKKILHYSFYTPSVDVKSADDLRKLLSSSASLEVYGGPKGCGGYHPDYCISWQDGETTCYALICFGCHEIVFYDGETFLNYDLAQDAYNRYKELLAVHESKRPKRPKLIKESSKTDSLVPSEKPAKK